MGRKKRGGAAPKPAPSTRKTRSSIKNIDATIDSVVESVKAESPSQNDETNEIKEEIPQSLSEGDESNSSEAKSCNTPLIETETEKDKTQPVTMIQHKKFGKFRCLIEENTKYDTSESEVDKKDCDSNGDDEITEGLKGVDLGATCTKEMIENIIGNVTLPKEIVNIKEKEESDPETLDTVTSPSVETVKMEVEETPDTPKEDEKSSGDSPKPKEDDKPSEAPPKDDEENTKIRRSSRIKSISVLKQKSRGRGVVKTEKPEPKDKIKSDINTDSLDSEASSASTSSTFIAPTQNAEIPKPVKVKSRWRRSSELEMSSSPLVTTPLVSPQLGPTEELSSEEVDNKHMEALMEIDEKLRHYVNIMENEYLTERISCREAKKMLCDCFLVEEEIERGELGCGEDCLNRLLMIECGNHCVVGNRCTNKRFQKCQYAPCEVFKTQKKGFGIRATANISAGDFIMEYVGEVLDPDEFDKRASEYSKDKNRHYYFMALRSDAVIDATQKGNISRFINHSCEPNAETQKWTVNGELRIGFFSTRNIASGEEITFDYQFQRYGKEAQKCFCEAPSCRGWIGEEPDSDLESEVEEEDEDEEQAGSEIKEEPQTKEEKPTTEIDVDKPPSEVKLKKSIPKEKREIIKRKKRQRIQRSDIFEDLDLDDAIAMLPTTGVKNQTHTLTLSRLMVRAKEINPRMRLLKLLTNGEEPCRRLFLDYHGLRLIHGWMIDLPDLNKEEINHFKLEILKALDSLPIKNKTILLDSKVLAIVEKWASKSTEINSPTDSENSPKDTQVDPNPKEKEKEITPKEVQVKKQKSTTKKGESPKAKVVKDEGATEESEKKVDDNEKLVETNQSEDISNIKTENGSMGVISEVSVVLEKMDMGEPIGTPVSSEGSPEESSSSGSGSSKKKDKDRVKKDEETEKKESKEPSEGSDGVELENSVEKQILDLCSKLLEKWLRLKEDFRIPKKERIKQMKEHEREANRGYTAPDEDRNLSNRYSSNRISSRVVKIEKKPKDKKEFERDRDLFKSKRHSAPQLTKQERRQLFAIQAAQEEEDRRKHQEMLRLHEQRCLMMGQDPKMVPFDPNVPYWNHPPNNWGPIPVGMGGPNMPNLINMPPNLINGPMAPNGNQFYPPIGPPQSVLMPQVMNMNINQSNNFIPNVMHGAQMVNVNEQPIAAVDPSPPQVFPPPVKLPPKWKCARDKYGRPYYYHIKIRISQWEPPEFKTEEIREVEQIQQVETSDSSSSSDTSSISSDSDSDSSEDDADDTKLLLEIRTKLKAKEAQKLLKNPGHNDPAEISELTEENSKIDTTFDESLVEIEKPNVPESRKRKREGLCTEIIISPRTEEDKMQYRIDAKKYKETKEKLKRQKELVLQQTRKKLKMSKDKHGQHGPQSSTEKPIKISKKHSGKRSKPSKIKNVGPKIDHNSEEAKRIKENFRKSMATTIVQSLNGYRKPDCKIGRITNTEDFKHLARKLTHYVMSKELKHCKHIADLTCNESVKMKASEFIRKYMQKFGEVYTRPTDEIDY